MLKVKINKVQDQTDEKTEAIVNIKVSLNHPKLAADQHMGFMLTDAPSVIIAEENLSFKEMKKVMDFHNLKNWQEVKQFIEDKYNSYYGQMFQDLSKFSK